MKATPGVRHGRRNTFDQRAFDPVLIPPFFVFLALLRVLRVDVF